MKQSHVQATIAVLKANKYKRVSLPEIQRAAGAQHGARIQEARVLGYVIDNEMERAPDGQTRSWYILRAEPGEQPPPRQEHLALSGEARLQYPD
jgi:hypothetical protein